MKKIILLALAAISMHAYAQGLPEWEDPQVIGLNKEEYHATLTLPSRKAGTLQIPSSELWQKAASRNKAPSPVIVRLRQ